jgi:hypothetical protein
VRAHGDVLDWDAVLERAAAIGTRRMLLLGVLLAHELLGALVPAAVLARARADRAVAHLALEVPLILEAEPGQDADADGLATDLFRLQLRERWRDRLRFVWYRLTTPSRPESWTAITIGERSFATHGLVRPFRLLSKLFSAFRQSW